MGMTSVMDNRCCKFERVNLGIDGGKKPKMRRKGKIKAGGEEGMKSGKVSYKLSMEKAMKGEGGKAQIIRMVSTG